MTNLESSALFQQLMADPELAQDILHNNRIITRVAPLGPNIAGMVYRSANGVFYIVANQMLLFEECRFVFLHELAHIVVEVPKKNYLVRLEHDENEHVADAMAQYAVKRIEGLI